MRGREGEGILGLSLGKWAHARRPDRARGADRGRSTLGEENQRHPKYKPGRGGPAAPCRPARPRGSCPKPQAPNRAAPAPPRPAAPTWLRHGGGGELRGPGGVLLPAELRHGGRHGAARHGAGSAYLLRPAGANGLQPGARSPPGRPHRAPRSPPGPPPPSRRCPPPVPAPAPAPARPAAITPGPRRLPPAHTAHAPRGPAAGARCCRHGPRPARPHSAHARGCLRGGWARGRLAACRAVRRGEAARRHLGPGAILREGRGAAAPSRWGPAAGSHPCPCQAGL